MNIWCFLPDLLIPESYLGANENAENEHSANDTRTCKRGQDSRRTEQKIIFLLHFLFLFDKFALIGGLNGRNSILC